MSFAKKLAEYFFYKKYGSDILKVYPFQFLPDKVKNLLGISLNPKYYSVNYLYGFDRISEHGEHLQERLAPIQSYSTSQPQIMGLSIEFLLTNTSGKYFGSQPGVIVFNINSQTLARMLERFEAVGKSKVNTVFQQDIVYIPASSLEEAHRILNRIPQGFADAILVHRSQLVTTNSPDLFTTTLNDPGPR